MQAGVDSMLVVPRTTHLEYTRHPARAARQPVGQALSSVYVQSWVVRYLKHRDNDRKLLGTRFRYLGPTGNGEWAPVTLRRNSLLSLYYCSAHALEGVRADGDITDLGC